MKAVLLFLIVSIQTECSTDFRNIYEGTTVISKPTGYVDQPYCIVNDKFEGEICCVITANDKAEGTSPGQYMLSTTSSDGGHRWTTPVKLEPVSEVDNDYGTILATSSGRVYSFYNMNTHNVTKFLNGSHVGNRGTLGEFVFKYSDDNCKTWSTQRYTIPYRPTNIDKHNTFDGKVKLMWAVDQVSKVPNAAGTGYSIIYGFTKVGTYGHAAPEEVWFLTSDNILTEQDASNIRWRLEPNGTTGIRPPYINAVHNIAEEPHVLPLFSCVSSTLYSVFRTVDGYIGSSHTNDRTGSTNWTKPSYAQYWLNTPTGVVFPNNTQKGMQRYLKNPRGPITLKYVIPYGIMMTYYFNSNTGESNRNPMWIVAADQEDGQLFFSQPEIVLYDTLHHDTRPGYADLFTVSKQPGLMLTESSKRSIRIHHINDSLIRNMFYQDSVNTISTRLNYVTFNNQQRSIKLPQLDFSTVNYVPSVGLSIVLRVEKFDRKDTIIELNSYDGFNGITFTMIPGQTPGVTIQSPFKVLNSHMVSDCALPLYDGQPHVLGLVCDAGAKIFMWMVDGMLCDGGKHFTRGWEWFGTDDIEDVNSHNNMKITSTGIFSGMIYNGALTTTEMVGNFRALTKNSPATHPHNLATDPGGRELHVVGGYVPPKRKVASHC